MTVWCNHCEKWSEIPADLASSETRVTCEHCGSTLNVESRYMVCLECGRYHRTGYEVCPFKVEGVEKVPALPASPASAVPMGGYSTEAQKRRSKKRGDEYYWQLYIDYRDKPVASTSAEEEPPHPADVDGYEASGGASVAGSGNGMDRPIRSAQGGLTNGDRQSNGENQPNLERVGRNGNGYGAPTWQSGAHANKNGNGSYGNGNGGRYGSSSGGYGAHKIDLALSESTPVMLFPEIEKDEPSIDEAAQAPVKVQAGNYNEFDYELIDDPSRLAQVAEILSQEKIVGIDTETTGLDPYTCQLLLLQISTLDKVYIIDCKRLVPLALKPMLENPQVLKVAQNAKFEYEMLKQQVGITIAGLFDTMLAERLVTAGIGREISLKAIAQKYIGATLDKSVRESFYKLAQNGDAYLAPEQLHYAARDAFIMIPIYKLQLIELKKHKLMQVAELEFRCIPAVGDMELAGVQIDVERWRKIIVDVAVQRDKAQEELSELLAPASMQATMFGVPSINLNSNMQLMEAFATLGVNLPDTMEATLVKYNHPAVAKLLEYRGHEKTLSAFGENVLSLINPKTGRIHPDFNQYGADTGRFSCLTGETLVSVVGGLKRLDAMQAGDIVLTSYGPKKVLRAWCNGVRPVLRVRLSDGRDLRLTADHQVLSGGGTTWVAAGELEPGDNLFVALNPLPPEQSLHPVGIDIDPGPYYTKRIATIPNSLSEPLCELAGLFTADGTLRRNLKYAKYAKAKRTQARYDQVRIALGWEDDELIALLKNYSLRLFNVPCREAKAYTCRVATINSTRVAEALARFGLAGTAHNKQVPEAILFGPPIFQAAYLRGLFEGDGHISNDSIGLTSVNCQLLQSVQIMLSRLGCYASIRTSHDDSGFAGSNRYRLGISGIDNMARFMQVVGFMSSKRGSKYIKRGGRITGADTPVHVSGATLYREAAAAGLVEASRVGVKPFVPLYKDHPQSSEGLKKLVERWGDLPELARAHDYITRGLHRVKVHSVEPDGEAPVYDLTIEEVSEFLATGLVVHNCTRPNVQQIPATSDFRKCFIAAEGYKLVTCDYSQAELRILAELSQDVAFVEAFKSGQDLHTLTASQMFGVPVDEVQKPQRSAAKAINFGLAYGMGPGGLAPRLGIGLDEAKELISRYFKAYPGIQRWLDRAAKEAVRLGYSATPLGRKRFYNIPDESLKRHNEDEWRKQVAAIERQGKNTPIQGSFRGNTRVFEKDKGYVTIESLYSEAHNGMREVVVWDGEQFTKGIVVYSGVKPIVRVTLYDGNTIECSPGHKFLVRNCNGRDMWKIPGQLKVQDRIVVTKGVPEWSCGADIPPIDCNRRSPAKAVSITTVDSFTDMGEWLGRLASDGSIGQYKGGALVRLLVAEHEESILPRLSAISTLIGNARHTIRVTEAQPRRLHTLTLSSITLYKQLRSMGVKEHIPECAWQDSELLASYLRGMFDGDATVHPDGAVLVFGEGHKHLQWAREIQHALLLFGIRSRVGAFSGRVHVKVLKKDMPLFCETIGFINPIKQEKALLISTVPRERTYGRAVRVKSVEFTDDWVDMYDVVNSESGRFMANGMIVHNSNADMTKLALINLRTALQGWDARTVNTVHDEIVVEVRVDQAEEVKHIVEAAMVGAGQAILKEVPIVADASLADYWSK